MNLARPLLFSLAAFLFACSAEDMPTSTTEDEGGSTSMAISSSGGGSSDTTQTSTDETASTSASADEASGSGPSEGTESSTGEACATGLEPADYGDIEGCVEPVGTPYCSEGQDHVPEGSAVEWQNNPPHSGPHYPSWLPWDEYTEPAERGNWVHNLEHGGVVLAYHCETPCEDELAILRGVMQARSELRIILTADPLLEGERFAAISWTWVHRFDTPDLDALLCFVDQHEGHAPEDVL